jgi:hypothetical protein
MIGLEKAVFHKNCHFLKLFVVKILSELRRLQITIEPVVNPFDQRCLRHAGTSQRSLYGFILSSFLFEALGSTVLKYCGKTPLFHDNCMLTLRIILRQSAFIVAICIALVLTTHEGLAQAPYDTAARVSLANEINQTYGSLVTPSLSITELFDIKNRLDKADSIAQNYGVDLDYREHSFIEMCDIENRIRLSVAINQQYGKNVDWRENGYSKLLQIEEQLRSQAPKQ